MKYQIIFFDCDGVLTDEGWRRLDKLFIPREVHQQWEEQFNQGKLTLDQWERNVIDILRKKGLTQNLLKKLYESVQINPEAESLFPYLHKNKFITAIVSAGFEDYVRPIAKKLKAATYRINSKIIFDKKGLFQKFDYNYPDPRMSKVYAIREICEIYKTIPEKTLFVGDSRNDLEAFKLTKHGVMYQTKAYEFKVEELEKNAWKKIKHLHEIKKLIA